MLCLLGPAIAWSFGDFGVKLGLIEEKELQVNKTYVDQAPTIELIQPHQLSEAEPAIESVGTDTHYYQKQILIYCLIGVSILFMIFATLYCYEANKEHTLQIERSNSFNSPSLSTMEEASVSLKDLSEPEEL